MRFASSFLGLLRWVPIGTREQRLAALTTVGNLVGIGDIGIANIAIEGARNVTTDPISKADCCFSGSSNPLSDARPDPASNNQRFGDSAPNPARGNNKRCAHARVQRFKLDQQFVKFGFGGDRGGVGHGWVE